MKKLMIALAAIALSACSVEEVRQSSTPNALATESGPADECPRVDGEACK